MMALKLCVLSVEKHLSSKDIKHPYKTIFRDGEYYYGQHLIGHCQNCNNNILSTEKISEFLISLCEVIDMVRFGDPLVARFGNGLEVGVSAVQLIETSAIVVHTNDSALEMYIDVFSCKDYSVVDAKNEIIKWFGSKKFIIDTKVLLRE